jgi:predicted lipoprotein with Yx(FWY)xxD motif/predicted small lipoprotein YifL
MNRAIYVLCLVAILATAIAGCGGGGATSDATTSESGGETSTSAPAESSTTSEKPKKGAWGVVFGAEGDPLGLILYDHSGHTLYTFSRDKGGASSCYGACAKTWPPALTEGKPKAEGEASPGKVATTKRKDGTIQLTYAGHPLYTHASEEEPETNGNGVHSFGGNWYAIRPNGERP